MSTAKSLQRILMPNAKFGSSDSMYIKGQSYLFKKNEIIVSSGGRISIDTYYNGFSTVLWKDECGISNVSFVVTGEGEAKFRLMLITEELVKYELKSEILTLSNEKKSKLDFELNSIEQSGIIYIEMISTGEGFTFSSGEWITKQEPLRKVKLGISITHFDRKNYVLPSMERIKNEILDDPKYSGLIDFTVVDNSKNITEDESHGIRVIPNENTGGAGGFMRGLLHYMDEGDFTHVIFMDDDASCESESIKKTYSILSYAIKDNTAIAGSLFMETRPEILIEKGAIFDSYCKPIFSGWDLKNIDNLVKSETYIQQPNYGAWWFFAFPIDHVKHMAFPFFVRGDDILFSMMNDFHIVTTNGIACYAEDFSTKVSPMTWYLDTRNHILNMLIFKKPAIEIIKTYSKFYLSCLLSHQYGSARSVRLALKHVLGDETFWEKNVDMQMVRKEISHLSENEKMLSIELPKNIIDFKDDNESKTRRFIRIISINGMLLPLKNKTIYQNKLHKASLRQIFRYKTIFYYNRHKKTGYISKVSRVEFFQGLFSLALDAIKIYLSIGSQRIKYSELSKKLTKEEFWRQVLIKK